MKKENYFKLLNVIGTLICVLFIVIMTIEITDFSPYNTRLPFFADRMLEFLLPGILCFILARICKSKFNNHMG